MPSHDLDDDFNAAPPPKVTLTPDDILGALKWSDPREVQTQRGPRLVSNATPSKEFYELYRTHKAELYAKGITFTQNKTTGKWQVAKWALVPDKIRVAREEAKTLSRATDADINVPAPDGLSYLGYQRAGIAFAFDREGVLIGDEMGLGKTIQAIGVINAKPEAKRILVLCPASLKLNWKRELEKWLVVKRPVFIADSKMLPAMVGIVIANYDILHKHGQILHTTDWDIVICDEAHYLKSRTARRSQMVFGFKAKARDVAAGIDKDKPAIRAKKRILLTGTPIANKPAELFGLINYLDPLSWPNFFTYAKRYCAAQQNSFGWDMNGASNLDELQDKLRSTILVRRLKKDVLTELPPKRRQIIELQPTKDMMHLIEQEREAYEGKEAQIDAMQARVELAKAADDQDEYAAAVESLKKGMGAVLGEISRLRRETAVAKIPLVIEHLHEIMDEGGESKVILMAHHKDVLAKLKEEFGSAAVMLVGDMDMASRQESVDRFQKDPSVKLFLGSIMAAGVGITLTASSTVVFAELDWVPGNVSQAEDRAHRIGQRNSVLVQHLVLEGSLDAVMARRIIAKQEVIDQALDNTTAAPSPDASQTTAKLNVGATEGTTREKIAREAEEMTAEQCAASHQAIRIIAGMCNGALNHDGAGFNKLDTAIGKDLASRASLTRKQAALARRIARKYARQLSSEILQKM